MSDPIFSVISWVAAGRWTETGESFHQEEAVDWIESDIKGEHNFGLKIKGDTMEPEFKEGEVVFFNTTAKAENGDCVII
jgi:SOS-response transcriptional repressor LexA